MEAPRMDAVVVVVIERRNKMTGTDIVNIFKAMAIFASVVVVCCASERIVDKLCASSNTTRTLRIALTSDRNDDTKEVE